jgi:predicted metal-dependent hydrolase
MSTALVAPAVFHHPQANQQVRLQEHLVSYALKRAPRRSIGFLIGAEGLSVKAPPWLAAHAIEAALQNKASWIVRNPCP